MATLLPDNNNVDSRSHSSFIARLVAYWSMCVAIVSLFAHKANAQQPPPLDDGNQLLSKQLLSQFAPGNTDIWGSEDGALFQIGRNASLGLSYTFPTGPNVSAPYPVIVYGHGLGAICGFYNVLFDNLAKQGIATVCPGDAGVGGIVSAYETVVKSGFADPKRMALGGHSLGQNAIVGAVPVLEQKGYEPRALSFSAGMTCIMNIPNCDASRVTQPTFFAMPTNDVSSGGGVTGNKASVFDRLSGPGIFATYPGTHYTLTPLSVANPIRDSVIGYTVAFYVWALFKDDEEGSDNRKRAQDAWELVWSPASMAGIPPLNNATAQDKEEEDAGGILSIFGGSAANDGAKAIEIPSSDSFVSTAPTSKWDSIFAKRVPSKPGSMPTPTAVESAFAFAG